MPARSQAQRSYLNAQFGHRWVEEHHFNQKGRLPMRAKKDKRAELVSAFMKKRKPSEVSDVRSQNPKMGKHKSRSGYAIPYSDDTSRSPYKGGRG